MIQLVIRISQPSRTVADKRASTSPMVANRSAKLSENLRGFIQTEAPSTIRDSINPQMTVIAASTIESTARVWNGVGFAVSIAGMLASDVVRANQLEASEAVNAMASKLANEILKARQ